MPCETASGMNDDISSSVSSFILLSHTSFFLLTSHPFQLPGIVKFSNPWSVRPSSCRQAVHFPFSVYHSLFFILIFLSKLKWKRSMLFHPCLSWNCPFFHFHLFLSVKYAAPDCLAPWLLFIRFGLVLFHALQLYFRCGRSASLGPPRAIRVIRRVRLSPSAATQVTSCIPQPFYLFRTCALHCFQDFWNSANTEIWRDEKRMGGITATAKESECLKSLSHDPQCITETTF